MGITLEQAKAFVAVAETGSFAKASAFLGKSHSAVIYAIKELETQTGLVVLDRSQYRNTLTGHGRRVLEECRKLLDAERELEHLCQELSSGWEPYILIVYDGLLPFDPIAQATIRLTKRKIPTRIQVISDFHRGVEESFNQHKAQIMISLLPPSDGSYEAVRLSPVHSVLVAHNSHPLVSQQNAPLSLADLRKHCFITVRGSDSRLNLSTSPLDSDSMFQVSDFYAKKLALLSGVGFGWMPQYMIADELRSQEFKILQWSSAESQTFFPHLYYRGMENLGRAGRAFMDEYLTLQHVPNCQGCSYQPNFKVVENGQ